AWLHRRRMVNQWCPDRHLVLAREQPSLTELVNMDQRFERHAAFVRDPRMNVIRIQVKEQPGHLRERWRSPRIDACAEAGGPGEPYQIPVISVVIRVVVRQKDVAQSGQWHIGQNKLTSHTVATVNDIPSVVPDVDGAHRTAMRLMATGKRDRQPAMWVSTTDLPTAASRL